VSNGRFATYNGPDAFLHIAGVTLNKGRATPVDADQIKAISDSEYDVDLAEPSKDDLAAHAASLGVDVPSNATKPQLEKAIAEHQASVEAAAGEGETPPE
jgi:hypothetical protein